MVERLKMAISRAREQRRTQDPAGAAPPPGRSAGLWEMLEEHELDPKILMRERIVTQGKTDPIHTAFDMLRTRLVKAALDRGHRHIGITSPTKGCGKTVVSANLALSFARNPQTHLMLVDLDMRSPKLSRLMNLRDRRSIRWLLEREVSAQEYLLRAGPHFALALNAEIVHDSAELLQAQETAKAVEAMDRAFAPDIVIYDLPPLLVGDEAMSFVPNLDAVLMVIAAGQTRPDHIEECETLLGEETNLLGVLLNKADPNAESNYYYNYGYGYGLD